MSQAKAMCDTFMQRLAKVDPIGPRDIKKNPAMAASYLHSNFIGSAKVYEKIFLEANKQKESP